MTVRFYSDAQGKYLGAFDGVAPPVGGIERDGPPGNARDLWGGTSWVADTDADLAAERQEMSLTFPQLLIGLVSEEWITEPEGALWLTGSLPISVVNVINSLPPEQRFAARARATMPSVVLRLDSLVVALAAAENKDPTEVDTFFKTYGAM